MSEINLDSENFDPACPKCHGTGMYFDDTHGFVCNKCCKHSAGFRELSGPGWNLREGIEICLNGCGTGRPTKRNDELMKYVADWIANSDDPESDRELMSRGLFPVVCMYCKDKCVIEPFFGLHACNRIECMRKRFSSLWLKKEKTELERLTET
jgi:hypothetical protein